MLRLCTIHGRHIALESGKSYVLGRAADCDIVVEDRASSRRHARIHVGIAYDVACIMDIESCNGTFVNDERIGGVTPLHAGNRIRIGATVHLIVQPDADESDGPLIDTKTQAMEHLALGQQVGRDVLRVARAYGGAAEFAGQLGSFSVVEILQMLLLTNRSGTVHLALEAAHAKVEIRGGEVVSALFDRLTGVPALQMLAKERTGLFWLVESDEDCPRTIREPATRLLINLCLYLDSETED